MANFDLMSYAKGAEYANDQNQQDIDNAAKTRRNEASLSAFEKQLKEYDDLAPDRQALNKSNMQNALLRNTTQGNQLTDQAGYYNAIKRAQSAIPEEALNDVSPNGPLMRAMAIQDWMRNPANGATPQHMLNFLPQFNVARGAALDHAQQNPDDLNTLLRHSAFSGGKYQVVQTDDGKTTGVPQFQLVQARPQAGPPDPNNPIGVMGYTPVPNVNGNLQVVTSALRSQYSPGVDPDLGFKTANADALKQMHENILMGNTRRADFNALVGAGYKGKLGDAAVTRAEAPAVKVAAAEQMRQNTQDAITQRAAAQSLAAQAKDIRLQLTKTKDLRQITALTNQLTGIEKALAPYRALAAELGQ